VEGREEEPADPGHPHQRGVSLGTHSCPICQRPVDGQTTIISHGGDEEAKSWVVHADREISLEPTMV
jgi:hypothetical protein